MGDACRTCDGVGTVRQRGRPGYDRVPCPACGGSGLQRPGPARLVAAAAFYRIDADRGLVFGVRGRPIGSSDTTGYTQIDGRTVGLGMLSAHRLIWVSVHGDIPDGYDVDHINGVKSDNRIANLEAVTHRENIKRAYRTGLKSNAGEKHPSHTLTDEQVREIRRRYVRYSRHANARVLAEELGVGRPAVAGVVAGDTWREVA